jgi:hypothetical protein
MILILFVAIGLYFLLKREHAKAIAVLSVPLVFILTLGLNKVHDGTDSLFFHYSRMYLAIPIAFALCLSFFDPPFQPLIVCLWAFVPNNYYESQIKVLESTIAERVKPTDKEVVIVTKVEYILRDCRMLSEVCRAHHVDLFVVANHFYLDAYAQGCAACFSNFPKTLKPRYERRTWRLLEDENKVYKTVMFIDMNNRIAEGKTFIKKIPGTIDLYLVENNNLKTLKLLDTLGITYRQFR